MSNAHKFWCWTTLATALGFASITGAVNAQEWECTTDCVEVGQWRFALGVGVGFRENPLHKGDGTPLIVLPEVEYYGKRFFLKNFELGYTLFENPRHQMNAIVGPSYDQMYFNRWDPLNLTDSSGFSAAPSISSPVLASSYSAHIGRDFERASESSAPADDSLDESVSPGWLNLNGQWISPSDTNLSGRSGNPITVRTGADESFIISGLQRDDELIVDGQVFLAEQDWIAAENAQGETVKLADAVEIKALMGGGAASPTHLASRDVKARRAAGLAGIEYFYDGSWVNLHLQGLQDVTGVHDGSELRAALIFPWFVGDGQKWALTLGASSQSREVLDYYYGVDSGDTSIEDLWYSPTSSGLSKLVRLDWQKSINRNWSWRAMAQHRRFAQNARASPLVTQAGISSFFIGGVYHF